MNFIDIENEMRASGHVNIAGIDEAGRGPIAGPVVAAAVILPQVFDLEGLDDSKKLTAKSRDILYDKIMSIAVAVGVGIVESDVIDDINILNATYRAMAMAVTDLGRDFIPSMALVDGLPVKNLPVSHRAIVKGDSKVVSIAAASVIAKVTRDRMLDELNDIYPQYLFSSHKGYGTKKHIEAIRKYGILACHRKSFEPVKSMCAEKLCLLMPELQ